MNKADKRKMTYKNFIEKLETNMFIKKYVSTNKDKVNILINHKIKSNLDDDSDDEDSDDEN